MHPTALLCLLGTASALSASLRPSAPPDTPHDLPPATLDYPLHAIHPVNLSLLILPAGPDINEAKSDSWVEMLEKAACTQCKQLEQKGCKQGRCDNAPRCWCSVAYEESPGSVKCPASYKPCDMPEGDSTSTFVDKNGDGFDDHVQQDEDAQAAEEKMLNQAAADQLEEEEEDVVAELAAKDEVEPTAPEPANRTLDELMEIAKSKGIHAGETFKEDFKRMLKRNGGSVEAAIVELCAEQLFVENKVHGPRKSAAVAACRATGGRPDAPARKKLLVAVLKNAGLISTKACERVYDSAVESWNMSLALEQVKAKTSDPNNFVHRQAFERCTGDPDGLQFGTNGGGGGGHGGMSRQDKAILTEFHNRVRREHCAPELKWSDDMAVVAQAFANSCPCGKSSPTSRPGKGELIAWSKANVLPTATDVAQFWYDESSDYKSFEDGGTSAGSQRFFRFTQMLWKGTTEFG